VSFCAQNGSLLDLTYEKYDIFNSVVVLNGGDSVVVLSGGDIGKKCRVVTSPISTAYFQYTCFWESSIGKIHGIFDN